MKKLFTSLAILLLISNYLLCQDQSYNLEVKQYHISAEENKYITRSFSFNYVGFNMWQSYAQHVHFGRLKTKIIDENNEESELKGIAIGLGGKYYLKEELVGFYFGGIMEFQLYPDDFGIMTSINGGYSFTFFNQPYLIVTPNLGVYMSINSYHDAHKEVALGFAPSLSIGISIE